MNSVLDWACKQMKQNPEVKFHKIQYGSSYTKQELTYSHVGNES